jgi:4a-hydroxytetrahydrobiopterin dehydratase
MQELDDAKPLRHAMHVDVSVAREHVTARLEGSKSPGSSAARTSSILASATRASVRRSYRAGVTIRAI